MSLAWYIAAEREVDGIDIDVDGKAIAQVDDETLEAIFQQLGVKHLIDFFSSTPEDMADFFADVDDDLETPDYPDEEWFSPEDGLKTVRALATYLRQNPNQVENQEHALEDLAEYDRILAALAAHEVRWHLSIDL